MTGDTDLDQARWDVQVATGQAVAGTGVEARMREARAAAGRLAAGLPGLLDELEQLRGTARPTLAELHACYLEVRQHTLSTDGMPFYDAIYDQAEYVLDEARELQSAAEDLTNVPVVTDETGRPLTAEELLTATRHEIADVTLATVTLANILGVTVEACIAEKTEADRGRG